MDVPTEQNLLCCACVRCPSHIEGDALMFCKNGASQMDMVERGCICRTCPVHIEYHLKGRAYCLRGKPKEQ